MYYFIIFLKKINYIRWGHFVNLGTFVDSNNILKIGAIQSGQSQNLLFMADIPDHKSFSVDLEFEHGQTKKVYNMKDLRSDQFLSNSTSISPFIMGHNSYLTRDQVEKIANSDFNYLIPKIWLNNIITNGMKNYDLKRTCNELDNLSEIIKEMTMCSKNLMNIPKLLALNKNIKSVNKRSL